MRTYTGDQTSPIGVAMAKCDPLGPLMINVVKLYSTPDGEAFTALGRVYSGAVRAGQKVKVRRSVLFRTAAFPAGPDVGCSPPPPGIGQVSHYDVIHSSSRQKVGDQKHRNFVFVCFVLPCRVMYISLKYMCVVQNEVHVIDVTSFLFFSTEKWRTHFF